MTKKIDAVKHELNPLSLMSLVLSFLSLAIVSTMIFLPKASSACHLLFGIDTFICLLFWGQLLGDWSRSNNKREYIKTHWIDFLASIPVVEQLRFARLLQIFRVLRLLNSSKQILRQLRRNRRETTIAGIFLLLTLLLSVGSAMMLILESHVPESNIKEAGDALWWVFVTISTVGYGDHYPVTAMGKILAAVIIICGVGLFGMVAGLVSSVISDPDQEKAKSEQRHAEEWRLMLENQQRLIDRLEAIERQLSAPASRHTPAADYQTDIKKPGK